MKKSSVDVGKCQTRTGRMLTTDLFKQLEIGRECGLDRQRFDLPLDILRTLFLGHEYNIIEITT